MHERKKILILSTGDAKGAYEAAYRCAFFLFRDSYDVALLVRFKSKNDPFIYQIKESRSTRIRRILYGSIERISRKAKQFDDKYSFIDDDERRRYVKVEDILNSIPFIPDLIISGMTDGFCNTNTLYGLKKRTNASIYSIMVDMASITGGCHYAWDCKGYTLDCKNCPAILDDTNKNMAYSNLKIKQKNIKNGEIGIIAGSGWTMMQARNSTLFKGQEEMYNLAGCIDPDVFNGKNREFAKRIFGIEESSKLIFCGSQYIQDERKGFKFFLEALHILKGLISEDLSSEICILIVGTNKNVVESIPFKYKEIDFITDYRLLSLAYQASDVFVCASIEDSGPLMVSEALACGTPVVGFEMGIVYDMVINGYNGYKAELKNTEDLAKGLKEILTLTHEDSLRYSQNAIAQVDKYSSYKTVLNVFRHLLKEKNKHEKNCNPAI